MSQFEIIKNFNTIKKNLKKNFTDLKKIRIGIVGDSSTQLLNQSIRGYGFDEDYNFEIYEADYDQLDGQLLDTSSGLYKFAPEFVIIFESSQKLAKRFYKSDKAKFSEMHIEKVNNYISNISKHLNSKIIYFNFPEVNDSIFGNFSNKIEYSFIYQTRKINYELMNICIQNKNLFILDYSIINAQYGKNFIIDSKIYYTNDMTISLDALPLIAKNITDIIAALTGKFKKCIILDLDNTLWGGIIGDDGIENIQIGDLGIGKVFTELQTWIKQLKERGIVLAVCSKNNEATAKDPFKNHPDMVIRLEDIAVFVANWNNKADNIRYIQSILNIGFDSMVFLDDNPAEREIVRKNLPQVLVPELPDDPSLFLDYLQKLNLFETASFSKEDLERTKLYQDEAGRFMVQKNFTNEDEFLASLSMSSEVKEFNKFNIPRVAQLSQRSNQFNLRTVRYSEEDVEQISRSEKYATFSFSLKDKFGDIGIICIIILEKRKDSLFIETWLMSCRVLKRGMENFTLNTIVKYAKEKGYNTIIGEHILTSKNGMVVDHFKNLGFRSSGNKWELKVNNYKEKKCHIKII